MICFLSIAGGGRRLLCTRARWGETKGIAESQQTHQEMLKRLGSQPLIILISPSAAQLWPPPLPSLLPLSCFPLPTLPSWCTGRAREVEVSSRVMHFAENFTLTSLCFLADLLVYSEGGSLPSPSQGEEF